MFKPFKMDIDLLAKMVKEVVMDHDSVTLPGVGSFVAELVPAAFADRGYTILPPYRRLYFSPRQGDDTLLADLYRVANPEATEADANRILTDFLTEMKEVLKVRKTIVFPGLGRLRATRENHFFFVADEDLDIYPAGFGLQPISLKTHEETPEEVAAAVASLAEILEPEAEPVAAVAEPEPVAAEPEPEPVAAEPEPANKFLVFERDPQEEPVAPFHKKRNLKGLWITLLVIGAVLVLLVAGLVIAGRVAPEWLDRLLYSPEEFHVLYP